MSVLEGVDCIGPVLVTFITDSKNTPQAKFFASAALMMDPLRIFVITADRMNITCFSVLETAVKPGAHRVCPY